MAQSWQWLETSISVLTSRHNNGNLLWFLDFLGNWTPVGLWNFFTGKVNEKGILEHHPPNSTLTTCARTCVCMGACA